MRVVFLIAILFNLQGCMSPQAKIYKGRQRMVEMLKNIKKPGYTDPEMLGAAAGFIEYSGLNRDMPSPFLPQKF